MSATLDIERSKFNRLLQLARDQMRLIEEGNLNALDDVLLAKRQIIESLVDAPGMLNADPALSEVVSDIKRSDKAAEELLRTKAGEVLRRLSQLNATTTARRAYGGTPNHGPLTLKHVSAETPKFLDRRY